jgi:ParB-like chromosome segregation protein Spo0J
MPTVKITYYKVEDLRQHKDNPRIITDAVGPVAKSIQSFGFLNPIVINNDNTILAGHVRLEAAKKLGMTEVPTIAATDLTEAQQKAFLIADNKVADNATFDTEKLSVLFADLQGLEFDLEETGFNDIEVDNVLGASFDILADELSDVKDDKKKKEKKKKASSENDEENAESSEATLTRNIFLMTEGQDKTLQDALAYNQKQEVVDISNSEALANICDFYLRSMGE